MIKIVKTYIMFREESLWIKGAIEKLNHLPNSNEVANIGSSTEHFRKTIQPHIHNNIIAPLQYLGWQVVNVDVKPEQGVDIIADVTSIDFSKNIKDKFALTICTNLLEHVDDIDLVINNLIAITKSGGYILITVPYKYKIHLDPIDNGFRPTPQEIVMLFKQTADKMIDSKIISVSDIDQYHIRKSRFPVWGYRERIAFYFGKRHKTSGVLFSIKK